jgi:hypothetical protein
LLSVTALPSLFEGYVVTCVSGRFLPAHTYLWIWIWFFFEFGL